MPTRAGARDRRLSVTLHAAGKGGRHEQSSTGGARACRFGGMGQMESWASASDHLPRSRCCYCGRSAVSATLAIWIGQNGARIRRVAPRRGSRPPRPLTHDLMVELDRHVRSEVGGGGSHHVERAPVFFYAEGRCSLDSVVVPPRPSDAVRGGDAQRCRGSTADGRFLIEAGLLAIPDEDEVRGSGLKEDEVERFKSSWTTSRPGDFGLGGPQVRPGSTAGSVSALNFRGWSSRESRCAGSGGVRCLPLSQESPANTGVFCDQRWQETAVGDDLDI